MGDNYEYRRGYCMSYSKIDAPLRTNECFRIRIDVDHHKDSPLEKLPINFVDDFPIADPLHLFDLGPMRKCLFGWISGEFNYQTKWTTLQMNGPSEYLVKSNNFLPKEIHRAMRPLKCINFWKGLEFRTFLLYVGPVILKDYLPGNVYEHFLMLSCAVMICSCKHYWKYLHVAESLFEDYIKQFIEIYGIDSVSSNVHNLCHVTADVRKFGHLSKFSTYPFESFLHQIKNILRHGNKPLEQVAKRIMEASKLQRNHFKNLEKKTKYPFLKGLNTTKQYSQIHIMEGVMLSTDKKNKWFLT